MGQEVPAEQHVCDHAWGGPVRWQRRGPKPSTSLLRCSNHLAKLLSGQLCFGLPSFLGGFDTTQNTGKGTEGTVKDNYNEFPYSGS